MEVQRERIVVTWCQSATQEMIELEQKPRGVRKMSRIDLGCLWENKNRSLVYQAILSKGKNKSFVSFASRN